MRERLRLAALLTALLVIAPGVARGAIVADYQQTGSEAVVSGVSHAWGRSQTDLATQKINVLQVAHDATDVEFDLGLPMGTVNARQRTSSQATDASAPGHRVVAAVNGDFWQTQKDPSVYAPAGLDVKDGELIAGGTDEQRAALGFSPAGAALIGNPTLSVNVTLPGDVSVPAAGVNRIRQLDQLMVYTPRFGASTGTDSTGVEIRLTGATLPLTSHGTYATTVAQVLPNAGNTPIGATDLILSASGAQMPALATLQVGDAVAITTDIDAAWQDAVTVVGGALLFTPGLTPDFSDPKYGFPDPRTAAGITAAGDVLLVTVDGRSETSGGLIMTDLVALMRSLGAESAINLDGGGSTTMVVDPNGDAPLAVANSPSQTYERRVNTTLQVVSTARPAVTVSAPTADIVPAVTTGKTDAQVRLAWSATTSGTVSTTELQILGKDGLWHDVALSDGQQMSLVQRFKFGRGYQYRVRITDSFGATSDWATSPRYVLNRYNENDSRISRQGAWRIRHKSSAIGQHIARSAYDGQQQSLSMSFSGMQVAVVAQPSAQSGSATVTVGSQTATVDLRTTSTMPRMVVAVLSAPGSNSALSVASSISVANASTRTRPYVDIDAILVLTTE